MDKTKLARKLMFLLKTGVLVVLASISFNAFAGCKHHHNRCGHYYYGYQYYQPSCNPCNVCKKRVVYYRGPDCCGYYHGCDCSRVVWVPCHWNVYGNYVPGYWMTVGR